MTGPALRVAIVGSGIAGLGAAHSLRGRACVTLFESADYFGGHTHTVDVSLPSSKNSAACTTFGVDTGFLVFNERTYPQLIGLFDALNVETAKSDMSFSVQAPQASGRGIEWSGSSLSGVFAQRSNLWSPKFLRMLADIVRFNRTCTKLAEAGLETEMLQPLGDFLKEQGLSREFRDWYFLPMMGSIWSCPTSQMLRFPVRTMIRFCHNHGLIQITNRPQWRTVKGGARHYVDKITSQIDDKRLSTPVRRIDRDSSVDAGGVRITTDDGTEIFDKVVLATHSDQALALLGQPSWIERDVLGAIAYQPNLAVLHTDTSVLPQRESAWAAWNYERTASAAGAQGEHAPGVCLHYLLNQLQPLPFAQPVIVSLNPIRKIPRTDIMGEFNYLHPVFDLAAIQAQAKLPTLQGQQHSFFCGAWTGYGFHEDGLKSGLEAARLLLRSQRLEVVV
ncbi:MAG: FAD-dependent oxidoreductase [Polaromonas sp.]|nr:FAD-dependent oxidoreductase [Polaromonas sp.]